MTANGPLPTTLVFLHDLPSLPRGAKVRFLGWYAFFFFLASCFLSLFSFFPFLHPPPALLHAALDFL